MFDSTTTDVLAYPSLHLPAWKGQRTTCLAALALPSAAMPQLWATALPWAASSCNPALERGAGGDGISPAMPRCRKLREKCHNAEPRTRGSAEREAGPHRGKILPQRLLAQSPREAAYRRMWSACPASSLVQLPWTVDDRLARGDSAGRPQRGISLGGPWLCASRAQYAVRAHRLCVWL